MSYTNRLNKDNFIFFVSFVSSNAEEIFIPMDLARNINACETLKQVLV